MVLSDLVMVARSTESSTKVDRLCAKVTILTKSVDFDQI